MTSLSSKRYTPAADMRKDDFQISLFGFPKCHFTFSQDEIERMRGFKRNFEWLVEIDFIKNQLYTTPIVLAGEIQKIIPEAAWNDFILKFRPFTLRKDRYHYEHVRRIAFRRPRCGRTDAMRLQITAILNSQKNVADDAFKNNGMFDYVTPAGETLSAFEIWDKYVYTYGFHVNISSENKSLPILKAFGFAPNNPNAKAHLAHCLLIKMAGFDLVYNHICDILYFIDNPHATEIGYEYRSRPYCKSSVLRDKTIERTLVKDKPGYCLLGKNATGPWESIGQTKLTVTTSVLEIQELTYSGGFHALSGMLSEIKSGSVRISVLTPEGVTATKRLLPTAKAVTIRGDKFVLQATILEGAWQGNELCLSLDPAKTKLTVALLGSASSLHADPSML